MKSNLHFSLCTTHFAAKSPWTGQTYKPTHCRQWTGSQYVTETYTSSSVIKRPQSHPTSRLIPPLLLCLCRAARPQRPKKEKEKAGNIFSCSTIKCHSLDLNNITDSSSTTFAGRHFFLFCFAHQH